MIEYDCYVEFLRKLALKITAVSMVFDDSEKLSETLDDVVIDLNHAADKIIELEKICEQQRKEIAAWVNFCTKTDKTGKNDENYTVK